MEMNSDDREELMRRRVAEQVTESVDRQIKTRYFWVALVLTIASLFGGMTLIQSTVQSVVQSVVQSRIEGDMEPVRQRAAETSLQLTRASLLSQQLSADLDKAKQHADKLEAAHAAIKKRFDDISDKQEHLKFELKSSEVAFSQLRESTELVKTLSQAVTDLNSKLDVKSDALSKLAEEVAKATLPNVIIHISGFRAKEILDQLAKQMDASGKYAVRGQTAPPSISSSTVRYFYKEDDKLAKEVAQMVANELQTLDIRNNGIPIADLSGLPIKPSNRTVEVWLNLAEGRLL